MTVRRAFLWGLVAALLAGPAVPQPGQADLAVVEDCLVAGRGAACIGLGAAACLAREGAMSAGVCLGAENAWWLGRIGAALQHLRAGEAVVIDRMQRLDWPEPRPSLERLTAGFDAYRDAACDWRAAAWEGIHAGFEEIECRLRLNARHALWLDAQARGR